MSIATDVNRAIDNGIAAFAEAVAIVRLAIDAGYGDEANHMLEKLQESYNHMAALARLSVPS